MNTESQEYLISYWISKTLKEYYSASNKFGKFSSPHEGYAIILEELDELWEEIKGEQSFTRMSEEAIQVASMALRFLVDCIQFEEESCDTQYS